MDYITPVSKPRLWKSKADFFRPFRTAAAEAGENIVPLFDPSTHRAEPDEEDLSELNNALRALVEIFPDVQPEVFREMLSSISAESRLAVVTEHLLTRGAKWVRDRRRPIGVSAPENTSLQASRRPPGDTLSGLPPTECFRSERYKKAVKQVFYQEFRNLSHSSIRAVLAEQNFSYALARPILQQLASKSWRFSLANLWPRRSPSTAAGDHPFVIWRPAASSQDETVPAVKRTGSSRLDAELYDLFVAPVLEQQRKSQLEKDYALATKLNDHEAETAQSLFECECCYSSVAFESLATCDESCHQLCFDCVRRTVNEALFGQGWSRTVDLRRSSIRCFSPSADSCEGVLSVPVLRRALSENDEKEDLWNALQQRSATENLTNSRVPLQRCPFCAYAEVNETPRPQWRTPMDACRRFFARASLAMHVLLMASTITALIFAVPLLLLASVTYLSLNIFPSLSAVLDNSWSRVHKQRRGLRFRCLNPSCSAISCVRCSARWRDPHTCFENEKTSLRTAIEASATAAVKRTCPKCLLSFVKSSGCNKLVCNCGYTMCYICRQEITSKEGYSHFCQHFRPTGGRCVECERCDLYGDEDEEAAIRNAARAAEVEWRTKEDLRDSNDEKITQAMMETLIGRQKQQRYWERWLDFIIDIVVA